MKTNKKNISPKTNTRLGDPTSVENMALLIAMERQARDENPSLHSTTSFTYSPAMWEILRGAGYNDAAEKLEFMAADRDENDNSIVDTYSEETFELRHMLGLVFQAGRIVEQLGLPNMTREYLEER